MDELERIKFVTVSYELLQGLGELPLGLFMLSLVAALVVALSWPVDEGAVVSALYVELVLTFITLTFIGLYFVVGGVLDHLLLTRVMKHVVEER